MDTGILDLPDSEEEPEAPEEPVNADAIIAAAGGAEATGATHTTAEGGRKLSAAPPDAATGISAEPAHGSGGASGSGSGASGSGSYSSTPGPRKRKESSVSREKIDEYNGSGSSSVSNPGVSDISSRMKKTRIVSFGGGGDDVFGSARPGDNTFAQSSDGSSGSNSAIFQDDTTEPSFPPIYSILRAAKQKKLLASRLASPFGFLRIQEKRIGYGPGGLTVPGDARGGMAQNFHCGVKGLNISFSIMRPDSAPRDELTCLACPEAHSFAQKIREKGCPVAIMATDQNFPRYCLPATESVSL